MQKGLELSIAAKKIVNLKKKPPMKPEK